MSSAPNRALVALGLRSARVAQQPEQPRVRLLEPLGARKPVAIAILVDNVVLIFRQVERMLDP